MSAAAPKRPARRPPAGVEPQRQHRPVDPVTGETGLTAGEEAFAAALALGLSQSAAYRKAYPASARWKAETVHARASELAASSKVAGRFSEILRHAAEQNNVTQADVLRAYLNIATADPRALVAYVRGACRFCYGKGHQYQFTPAELLQARAAHAKASHKNPDAGDFSEAGGTGFDLRRPPADDCPECFGQGVGRVLVHDSASYDDKARALFAGVKEGKDGTEVKLHDQMAAWAQIARHVGFFERDNEQQAGTFANKDVLDEIYDRKLAAARERSEAVKGRVQRLGLDRGTSPEDSGHAQPDDGPF